MPCKPRLRDAEQVTPSGPRARSASRPEPPPPIPLRRCPSRAWRWCVPEPLILPVSTGTTRKRPAKESVQVARGLAASNSRPSSSRAPTSWRRRFHGARKAARRRAPLASGNSLSSSPRALCRPAAWAASSNAQFPHASRNGQRSPPCAAATTVLAQGEQLCLAVYRLRAGGPARGSPRPPSGLLPSAAAACGSPASSPFAYFKCASSSNASAYSMDSCASCAVTRCRKPSRSAT